MWQVCRLGTVREDEKQLHVKVRGIRRLRGVDASGELRDD